MAALLEFGASVAARDDEGLTALHHACWAVAQPCVHLLLEVGADPNVVDETGETPPMVSARLDDVKSLERLVQGGSGGKADLQMRDENGCTPLDKAHERGKEAVVEYITSVAGGKKAEGGRADSSGGDNGDDDDDYDPDELD